MAHWHDFNPWAAKLIYTATIDEWLDCLAIQSPLARAFYRRMHTHGKSDAYILPSADGHHSMGLRVGPSGEEYHSPPCNAKKAQALIDKYQPAPTTG